MARTAPSIAIAFDLNFQQAAQIYRGVSDYVTSNGLDWRLIPLQIGFESKLIQLAESGQLAGAIGTFVSDSWIQRLRDHKIEVINLFNFSKIDSVPSVGIDDPQLGKDAARHLMEQGARKLAYYGTNSIYSSRLRLEGFSTISKKQFQNLNSLNALKEFFVKNKPSSKFPVGIFCSSDRLAREVIHNAQETGHTCGKDCLILGVDDDPSESIYAGVEISSFKIPVHNCGYQAAKILNENLEKTKTNPSSIYQYPFELIARESSLASKRARISQRASKAVSENIADPNLDATSLARRIGASKRALELALKSQLETSPYRLISQARLSLAKQLLKETKLPVMEIGLRCGYPEPHHFSTWFKKNTQSAPKVFRAMSPSV